MLWHLNNIEAFGECKLEFIGRDYLLANNGNNKTLSFDIKTTSAIHTTGIVITIYPGICTGINTIFIQNLFPP